ncbi:MAG: hypothetical protein ILA02_01915 [Clostridia bacterium]|nr:hypothetical protein [Clostridia bacterium]
MRNLNIAIGFVTGRPNVCNIINTYYEYVKKQMQSFYKFTNISFYILYDLDYQDAKKEDFYNLKPEIFEEENIKVKYITPEDVAELKQKMMDKYKLTTENVNAIIGNGHAKGRNTVMYSAYCDNMDYLLFWDDDEYPVACLKNEDGTISWQMQDNVLKHIETMEKYNADVTIGYHCGYISPIPYMNFENEENEQAINHFIKAISNEIVTWESIKEKYAKSNGVTFAENSILNGEPYELLNEDGNKFVAGSTLCINLNHIENIPAFYNPVNARGEDTFFSLNLAEAKVMKVPVYHFHDGFLKYKQIMSNKFPKTLRLIRHSEDTVEKRFYKACLGWIKYKPLLVYILEKDKYRDIINDVYNRLEKSIPKINSLYPNYDFGQITEALKTYDQNVENDYNSYIEVNNIWNELKMKFYSKPE